MSDLKPVIRLQPAAREKCIAFGAAMVRAYEGGLNRMSASVSSHGFEHDPIGQARAKAAEVAVALWLGTDLNNLNWSEESDGDGNYDIAYRGHTIDVKCTVISGRYLIWPVKKNHLFDQKKFSMMLLVRTNLREVAPSSFFEMAGFIFKIDFRAKRQIAGAQHKLTEGTRYVDMDILHDPYDLLEAREVAAL